MRSGGLRYVQEGHRLAPGSAKTFKAACPKRAHVLGGGHYNSGGYGDVIGAHSYPYDGRDRGRKPDDGWAAQLRGFGVSHPVSVFAVCAKLLPEYPKTEVTIDPGGGEVIRKVTCPTPALSVTGAGSRGPASVREVAGAPFDPDIWEQGLANHGTRPSEVTLWAVCSSLTPTYVYGNALAQPHQQTFVQAQCPPDASHVTGGGLASNSLNQGNNAIAALQPFSIGAPFDGWRSWMDNYDDAATQISAVAICVPGL
jgi:hypothetical protein